MSVNSEISLILNNSSALSGFIQIADSKHVSIFFSSADKTLILDCKKLTNQLTMDEFQEGANLLLNQVIMHKPVFIITDLRLYRHNLSDEQHNWLVNNIVPKLISNRIILFAIVMNEDLRQQAKLEEIIDDVKKYRSNFSVPVRFFASIEEALRWK